MRASGGRRHASPAWPVVLLAAAATLAVPTPAVGKAAPKPAIGGTCTRAGSTGVAKDGRVLVCTRLSKTRLRWQLPPLGSSLRPVPLGQALEAGPAGHRFRFRVVGVEPAVAAAQLSESATDPAPGMAYIRVRVEGTFVGPAPAGNTGHVWEVVDTQGRAYAASEGCSGGYGSDFDVETTVAVGASVTGAHCITVPASTLSGLRLRVQGWGDRADTYFALRA